MINNIIPLKSKTRRESYSVMTELVLPNDANLIGNLLGGKLLHYIDIAAALTATRHTEGLVATMIMDAVEFRRPVKVGSILELRAYVTWTGTTSLEVAVEVFSENYAAGVKQFINRTYLLFVAIDECGCKRPVPSLSTENDAERKEFAEGAERRAKRMTAIHS